MNLLLLMSLLAADITWTQQSLAGNAPTTNGYLKIVYDSVSSQTIVYAAEHGSTSIYSDGFYAYTPGSNTWVRIGGTGETTEVCIADTNSMPGSRHPYGQIAADTNRNLIWLYSGVCQGNVPTDLYRMSLNADPSMNVLTRVFPSSPIAATASDMSYNSLADALILSLADGSGHFVLSRYCSTIGNLTPGTLTSAQMTGGCTAADDFAQDIVTTGGPRGLLYGRIVCIPGSYDCYHYGGCNISGTTCYTDLWKINVATLALTELCGAGCTAPPLDSQNDSASMRAAMVYNPQRGTLMLHHFVGTNGTSPAGDYEYTISTDRWAQLTANSVGPNNANGLTMSYGPANTLVAWDVAAVWVGAITANAGGTTIGGKVIIGGKVVIH